MYTEPLNASQIKHNFKILENKYDLLNPDCLDCRILIPNNDLIYTPISCISYELIPTGQLLYDTIPLNNLESLDIPNGELLYGTIPLDNLSALDIPNGELLYETIPLDNFSVLDIPNGDLLYVIIQN
jgi:hypothetical protein